ALLGGTAGRVTLDDEDFAQRRVLLLAVGEFSGEPGDVERALAASHLARLARGFARTRRVDDLADDRLGFGRVLEQEFGELFGDRRLDDALHFRREQLVLGLRGELGIGQLHRKDCRETFAGVVTRGRDLLLLGRHLFFDVVVERARKRGTEAGEMGAAVLLRDVVRVAEHRFGIRIVPLHGYFDPYCSFLGTKPEDIGVYGRA